MVNRIDIEVSARGNFSQLNAQIAELKAAVAQLQSKPLLGDTGRATTAQLAQIQTQFDKMLLSTRAFNVETVKMSNAIDNFGNRLQAGKLHFSEYARIYRQTMKGMRTELDSLADSQARVAKSVVLPDALRTGYARVITNLTSDLRSLNAAEEAAIIKTKALNTVIHGMGTSLVNMGKNTQWAGRQLTVGLTVPVAAFGAMAAKVFKDVNTELTRMQRMYGTGLTLPSEQEITKVSNQVLALSRTVAENMGIAQAETVKAAANFAAVGVTGDNLVKATEQAMRLSKLGAVSSDVAQKTIVSLQTTFKVGNEGVAEAVNFLNDIQKQTSTDLQDLTDAIPRVGPIVAQLGGTYKDTAVMMVAMKEAGVPAAQSANAIKSAVASMIGPTRQARDEFEKYGISLTKIKDDTQGNPIEMIQALQGSMAKLSPLVKEQLIEKLFGKFQFARVTALIENLGRAGSQTENAFKVARASASELANLANQEMKIATESTTAKWSRALESFKATLMPLGEKFMKFGTKVLEFFTKIMHFLDRFKPLENLLVNVLGGAALVGPVLMLVGLFGNLFGNIIKGINYFRMFARGVKTGGVMEGFRGMANMFEMINVETLASSKNMDGLTTSTEKTVEAFTVLNHEIGIMTKSLNEVFARSTRMPIVASPYAQQTLAELQYANPNYNKTAGATEAIERPHMFPASRLWGGWNENSGNIQGQYPMLGAFLGNKALFQSTDQQKYWMRKGTSEQWGAPVPSGGAAAELQQKFGKENVIYGSKFGVSKEDVYTRGFQKLEQIKLDIITGEIKADSKAAAEMEKIAALPIEEQTAALTSIIDRVVFSEEQYFTNLIETLVQSQALLSAPEDMLKAVDMKIKTVMSDPTIADKPAEIQKVIGDFNRDFKLLGGTIVEDISAYRLLVEEAIMSTNSAFETAIVAAQFRAGIVSGAEMSGGIRSSALGKVASMDKQPLSQALLFARQVPKGFQTGGAIHAQDGVWVPGTGSGDRVPAMLEPGEFVVNRNAAKQYGGLLEHLNWNAAPRFGTGGDTGLESIGIKGYQNAGEVEEPSRVDNSTYAARNLNKLLGSDFSKLPGSEMLSDWWNSNPNVLAQNSHSILGNSRILDVINSIEGISTKGRIFAPGGAYLGPADLNQILGYFTRSISTFNSDQQEIVAGVREQVLNGFKSSVPVSDYENVMGTINRGAQALNYDEALSTIKFLKHIESTGAVVDTFSKNNPKVARNFLEMATSRGEAIFNNVIAMSTAGGDIVKAVPSISKFINSGKSLKDILLPGVSTKDAVGHYQLSQDMISKFLPGKSNEELFNLLQAQQHVIRSSTPGGSLLPNKNAITQLLSEKQHLNPLSEMFISNLTEKSPAIHALEIERLMSYGFRLQKGGGIPGYQSGVTPVPSMKSLNKEEQEALMKEYIQKTMRPSSALSLLQDQIYSTVGPAQLELMQKGYGHEILQSNPKLAKLLEEYTFNTKSFVLRPGYTPERTKFDIFNTLGKDERFLLSMGKTAFETWQPVSMFASSERSPLFIRTLAQAIKEQGRGIGSIGIVPEELDLSPFSQKMYENLRKRGMPIETSGYEYDFRPNLYSQNDVDLEESRTTTKHIIDRFLRRVTTDELFNNSLTYRSTGEGPLSSVLNRAYVEQTDVQHRIPEVEAKATLMKFLRQGLLKQKGGGIPGYEEGGGPTWMARGNPYTEAQFQKSLESWIRPILHGMAPWNNPEKNTYRPMGETYNGFYRDIFNDQMRNIGRQDLLRAMVVDNVKGGANMHPWLTNMVNAAEDRYYPPDYKGIRVPAMENIQGPWVAQTTRPFTSFTDIKDTDFLKKRFMPAFSDKRFWNAMVRGNKLPFFLHAMTGPETMGLPVSKLFAGQTYYGNEGEYVLPQGQKFPMTGYSSDLATRLPIVHSIAPGSTKMIGGMRIPVAQTGGIIPGFQDGYTDYLGSKITGPLGYAVQSGITGTYNLETSTGPQTSYLKQMFEPGYFDYGDAPVNKREMVMEAFLNQLQRGLGGSQAAVDQVFSRLIDPSGEGALKETSVLRSKFLEGFETYKSSGLSTTISPEDFKGRIDPKQTFQRYMESLLIGNNDLHDENFGYVGKTPTVVDSGITDIHNLLKGHRGFDNTIPENVSVGHLHEMGKVAKIAKTLLQEQGIKIEDFGKGYLETLRSKVSEDFIHKALLKATGGVPELMTVFDELTQKTYGANFVPAINKVLHARLDNMAMYTDLTNSGSRMLSTYAPAAPAMAPSLMKNFITTRLQTGGSAWVPGFGEGDRVPAMLEPGEFVINKKAAKAYGGLLEDINWNKAPRFGTGNKVGRLPRGQGDYITQQREQQRGLSQREMTRAAEGKGSGTTRVDAALTKTGQTISQFNNAMMGAAKIGSNIGSSLITAGQSLKVGILNGAQALKESAIATREANMTRGMIAKNELRGLKDSVVNGVRGGVVGAIKAPGGFLSGVASGYKYPQYSGQTPQGTVPQRLGYSLGNFGYNAKEGVKEGGRNFGSGFTGARHMQPVLGADGKPVLDERGNPQSRYGKFSEAKGVSGKLGYALGRQSRPGMGSMIGGQMVGMAAMQMAGGMQEGTTKSALSGAGMGAMLGGMTPLGPIGGAAIGAIASGAYSVYKQHEQKLKNAAALVKDSLNMSAIAMQHLGVQARDFSNIMIDASGKVTKSTTEFQVQVNDYKNAQDEETKTAVQGMKDKLESGDTAGIKESIQTRIATQMSSLSNPNDPEARKKVIQDNKAFVAATGAGLATQRQIFAGTNEKTMTPEAILKQQVGQLGLRRLTANTSRATARGGTRPTGAPKAGEVSFDKDKMSSLFTQLQTKTDPLQLGKMFSGGVLEKGNTQMKQFKETMNTVKGTGFKQLLESVKKMDPALAKLDEQYGRYITDGTQIIRINNLMSSGMGKLNISQQKLINTNPNLITGLEAQYSAQSAVTGGIADWVSNAAQYDAQQNDQTDAANKAAEALQNQKDHLNDLINGQGDYINSQNKAIDKVQKEMDARNKLADTQNKEIERERTLADLKDSVTAARSSGNLLQMASAQSKYNEELAKQEEAKKKEAADAADEKKIAGFKANIDKANKQIEKYNKKLEDLDKASNDTTKTQSKNWNTISGKTHKAETAVNDVGTAIKDVGSSGTWTSLKDFQEKVLGQKGMKGKLEAAGLSSDQVREKIAELYTSFGGSKQAKANAALVSTKDAILDIKDAAEKALAVQLFTNAYSNTSNHSATNVSKMARAAQTAAHGFTAATSNVPTSPPTPTQGMKNGAGDGHWYQDPKEEDYYWLWNDKKFFETPSDEAEMKSKQGYGWHNYSGGKWGATIKAAYGGMIHAATGIGPVMGPGGPRDDLIPAMLSNGEYVIQASSVNKYGSTMMDAINGGNFAPRYATGGIMRSYSVGGDINNNSVLPAPQYNVNIVVNGANASADDIADMVATRFRRETESMSSGRSLRV